MQPEPGGAAPDTETAGIAVRETATTSSVAALGRLFRRLWPRLTPEQAERLAALKMPCC